MKEELKEKKTELICIRCPMGCMLTAVEYPDKTVHVTGNSCSRGGEYGKKELKNPTRTLTTTVKVKNGKRPVVSVRTGTDIPKGKIADCMKILKELEVKAPVHIGDIILADAAGTGADIVATKDVQAAEEIL